MPLSIRTCIHSYQKHQIRTMPYTINIGYKALTSQLQQVEINRAGQPFTKILLRFYGGQKKPAKRRKPILEKKQQEILSRQNSKQLAAHPTRLYSSDKINF